MDIEEALRASLPALRLWEVVGAHPDAPPFSGGVMDAWPAWGVDALSIIRAELAIIRAVKEAQGGSRGRPKPESPR